MTESCSEIRSVILYKLHFMSKEINAKFSECTGVSQSRYELLQRLYESEEELSQQELQQELNIDNAAITRHMKQMEAEGMISRRKKASDNRVTLVKMTEQGRSKIAAVQAEKQRLVTLLFADMSEEQQQLLLDTLNHLVKKVKDIPALH